jgi:hypothetical protein
MVVNGNTSNTKLPDNWRGILEKIVKIVRKYDKKKYIGVNPSIGGEPTHLSRNYTPLDDDKIIYGFSMWLPFKYTLQGIKNKPYGLIYPGKINGEWWDKSKLENTFSRVIDFQKKYNVLISSLIGVIRTAPGRDQYTKDLADIYKKHGFARFSFNGAYSPSANFSGFNIFYDGTYANGKAKFTFVGDTSTLLLLKKLNSQK